VATPAVAAELLAGLEYVHVNDSPTRPLTSTANVSSLGAGNSSSDDGSGGSGGGGGESGGGIDVVTVTVTDGGCFYYDDTRLTVWGVYSMLLNPLDP
jgi:uncharacterized membrane protein